MLDKRKFYINGKWVNSLTSKDFEVITPSNEEFFVIISLKALQKSDFISKINIYSLEEKFS